MYKRIVNKNDYSEGKEMVIAVVVGFVVVVVIVIVHIYSNSPPKAGCDTRSSFSGIKLSFLLLDWLLNQS